MNAAVREVSMIGTPYGMGIRGFKFGTGPLALLADGELPKALSDAGVNATLEWVDADEPGGHSLQLPAGDQLARYLQQNYDIQAKVSAARSAGRFPLLSSGSCTTALGVMGGLDTDDVGVIWIDAHADASTPETSVSGFFDGMPVAIINGQCWKAYRESIPGFHTVPTDRIISVGMHDLQPNRPGPVGRLVDRDAADAAGGWLDALNAALADLSTRTKRVYIHFDTDALDGDVAKTHEWAAAGGLSVQELEDTLDAIFDQFDVLAINFTAYDADVDPKALPIIKHFAAHAAKRATQGAA